MSLAELVAHFQDGLDAGRTPSRAASIIRRRTSVGPTYSSCKTEGSSHDLACLAIRLDGCGALFLLYATAGLLMSLGRPSVKIDYLANFNKPAIAVPEDQRLASLSRCTSRDGSPSYEREFELGDAGYDRRKAGRCTLEGAGRVFENARRLAGQVTRSGSAAQPRIRCLDLSCRLFSQGSRAVRRQGA